MSRSYTDYRFGHRFRAAAGRARPRERYNDDPRIETLIRRLPAHRQPSVRWLRSPAARWVRVPLGVFLVSGSFLFILPIFGLWMLPVGLLLLAEDVAALRRLRRGMLDWIERRRPHWFAQQFPELTYKREQMP